MNLGVRPPEQTPSQGPTPSLWQSIGKALGRIFKAIISFPASLLDLATRITNAVRDLLFKPTSTEQSTQEVPQLSKLSSVSEETEIFNQTMRSKETIEEDLGKDAELFPSQPGSPVQSPQSSPRPMKETMVQPEPKSARVETSHAVAQLVPRVVDVPDDGNCLLYAIGVGLRTKYAEYPDIQNKLKWNISAEQLGEVFNTSKLTEGTDPTKKLEREQAVRHLAKLLEAPGKQLRQQASEYLEDHASNDDIMLALIEGIGSHLGVARKKIEEEEAVVGILMTDIEELEDRTQTTLVKEQLEEKKAHLQAVQESIDFQQANLPSEEDFQGYIEITKKDHVYCGIAQLFALSKEYHIPIRVLYNYGKADQYEQTFNEELKNNLTLPTLTVAHVNQNHFKFVND